MDIEPGNPKIDPRNLDEIFNDLKKELGELYTLEWTPFKKNKENKEDEVGIALLKIYSHMLTEIIQRLNRVPEKNFLAFLDMLGIQLLPAQPAAAPITFILAEGAKEHVFIPAKTQVAAEEIIFETEKSILATPAKLVELYSFNPENDELYGHMPALDNEAAFSLLVGENLQEHILYLGHKDLFNITGQAEINLSFDPVFTGSWNVSWEYFGEDSDGVKDWHDLTPAPSSQGNQLDLDKSSKGEIAEHEINGIKSRWIRCRVKPGKIGSVKDYQLDTVSVTATSSAGAFLPDMAFYNDVPLDIKTMSDNNPIYPLGKIPRLYDTFYIASQEVFSKKGASVTLNINAAINGDADPASCPMFSWEYWNGKSWMRFSGIEENFEFNKNSNETSRSIEITIEEFPALESIEINGQENFWIRIRLVGGHFGQEYIIGAGNQLSYGTIAPPKITLFTINYDFPGEGENLEHVLIKNNLEFKDVTRECKTAKNTFTPFQEFAQDHGALYLGLDKEMEKGPVSFFFSIDEETSNKDNMPEIDWFYYSEDKKEWVLLDTIDNTNNLTASGTVEFLIPRDFTKTSYFGKELYRVKAVDPEDKMQTSPVIKGIYLNTVLALQAESIEEEILGSSDGSANQAFKFVNTPVIEQEIRVNETTTLTEEEKNQIIKEKGEEYISGTKDETGITTDVWVRWQPVKDFLDSSPNDRHYLMDGAMGEITFGSGINGKIPPIGSDNIKANYRTGGGVQGNLQTKEISELKTSLVFVDSVTNNQPGQGGSDTEQLAEVLVRGPHLIKHRNRAVTEEDFQRLAREASNYIARTKCLVKDNKLIIIIIPKGQEDKPIPSPGLLRKVKKYLVQRSLNIINPSSIEVHPPAYAEIKVTADIVPTSIDIAVPLEEKIIKQLKEFFHPLSGGPEGTGWQFGRDVHISDVYAMLESIEGVDHVETLELNDKKEDVTVEDLETVCPGTHDITMTLGG